MSKESISPDNRLPATLAAQLQQDLFAHPSAGPIPVAASTVELAIQELRRLQTACDKHSESDLLLEGSARERCGACQGSGEGGAMGHCSVCNGSGTISVNQKDALELLTPSILKDAERYRWLRDGEEGQTFVTSREERARLVADVDVDLDRYIDDYINQAKQRAGGAD